jgi:hypothetical protein
MAHVRPYRMQPCQGELEGKYRREKGDGVDIR